MTAFADAVKMALLGSAFQTSAACGFYVFVKIFGIVIVGQLLAGLDGAFGEDENTLPIQVNFAVGRARVIDAPRDIALDVAVYHRAR